MSLSPAVSLARFLHPRIDAVSEPLIDYKWREEPSSQSLMRGWQARATSLSWGCRCSATILEQVLKYRRPEAILIDEAQHFAKTAEARAWKINSTM